MSVVTHKREESGIMSLQSMYQKILRPTRQKRRSIINLYAVYVYREISKHNTKYLVINEHLYGDVHTTKGRSKQVDALHR